MAKDVTLIDVNSNKIYPRTFAKNVYMNDGVTTIDEQKADRATVSQISNPNLVINGDFKVNQRGQTTYAGRGYTVDRWINSNNYTTTTIIDTGVRVSASGGTAYLLQDIENAFELYKGKTLTFSLKMNGTLYTTTGTMPTTIPTSTMGIGTAISFSGAAATNIWLRTNGMLRVQIGLNDGYSADIEYMKVEVGNIATPFSPRPYDEELALCERYYQEMSFTTNSQIAGGISNGSTCYAVLQHKGNMRTTPTVTFTTPYNLYNGKSGGSITINSIGIAVAREWQTTLSISHSTTDSGGVAVPAGSYQSLRMQNGSKITFDAEIY